MRIAILQMKMLGILLVMISFVVQAKIYKWVDENGVTHYSENQPEDQEVTEIKVKGMPDNDQQAASNSEPVSADVDCQMTVRRNLKLLVADIEAKGDNNSYVEVLNDPKYIIDTIAKCNREIKDPAESTVWICQQKATNVDEIKQCEERLIQSY